MIIICAGTGCMAGGAMKVYDAFVEQIAAAGMNVEISLEAEARPASPQGPTSPRAAARVSARWVRW